MDDISTHFFNFFNSISLPLSKPNLKVLSFLIPSMVNSESVVTADLAKSIKSPLFSSNSDSTQKRIWRFLNNPHVNLPSCFDSIISFVVKNISNVRHDKLIVTLDQGYSSFLRF